MDQQDFHHPTPDEIDAHIRAARKLQAETLREMTKSALRWLTHPRFGHRHA